MCLVLVKESATNDVNSESIEPNTAIVKPIGIMTFMSVSFIAGRANAGKLLGISPIVFTSNPNIIATDVPIIKARSAGGITFAIFFGVKNTINKAKSPIIIV